MKKEQAEKIITELRGCNDVKGAFDFCKDLSNYLKKNLDENIIKDVQREYIKHFKENLTQINQYISSKLICAVTTDSEKYSDTICKKKLVEHSILFFDSNDFIDDKFDNEYDEFIFKILKGSKNKINKEAVASYNYGATKILHRFGAIFKYDSNIHKDFSVAMISFIKENLDNYSDRIKNQLNIILHALIVYCGDKIDYNRMVFSNDLSSEEDKRNLINIGDILSSDKEYYKNRFLSIKRSSGYMDKREAIIRHSLDSGLLDTELAELGGKLSKNNAYYLSRHLAGSVDRKSESFSSYARTLIMSSKHYPVYQFLHNKLSKQDFIMCLPIFSEHFSNNIYFHQSCQDLLAEYQK